MRARFTDPDTLQRWAIAAALALLALSMQWSVRPWVGTKIPFLFFLPAIVATAARCGRRAGLFVTGRGLCQRAGVAHAAERLVGHGHHRRALAADLRHPGRAAVVARRAPARVERPRVRGRAAPGAGRRRHRHRHLRPRPGHAPGVPVARAGAAVPGGHLQRRRLAGRRAGHDAGRRGRRGPRGGGAQAARTRHRLRARGAPEPARRPRTLADASRAHRLVGRARHAHARRLHRHHRAPRGRRPAGPHPGRTGPAGGRPAPACTSSAAGCWTRARSPNSCR